MKSDDGSLILQARVKPGARRDYICWIEEGNEFFLQIEVKSSPIKGKANQSLLKLIKKKLNRNARLLKGHSSSDKLLGIEHITLEQLKSLLPKE